MTSEAISEVHWTQAIAELNQQGENFVIVTVLNTHGSTPRDIGTKMVVAANNFFGTIGGGNLEHLAIQKSRELLSQQQDCQLIERFPLGAKTAQCCGGEMQLMFEAIVASKLSLDIYGAGHVARALIDILAKLPLCIRWIDSRAELFPDKLPMNVTAVSAEEPAAEVNNSPENSAFLVLTHDHQLDLEICHSVLKLADPKWLGLIGSETKAKRFRYQLQQRGITEEQLSKLNCPVGLLEFNGKLPMEIAVSIAAQLIAFYQQSELIEVSEMESSVVS